MWSWFIQGWHRGLGWQDVARRETRDEAVSWAITLPRTHGRRYRIRRRWLDLGDRG